MRKTALTIFLLLGLLSNSLVGQTVKGIITDAQNNKPLPGVTIIEKGTINGTVSDKEGFYSIDISTDNPILIFSFLGYTTIERDASGISNMNITMEPSEIDLDEVVVIAYGSAKKSTFTGSATVVNSKKLEKMQVSSFTQALQGSSSGLQVISANGQPGSEPTIRIRGISSINGVSSPLIVVDGAPYGGYLSSINPNDIESVSILKDASATTLYGSRAAAGVIMITTKSGIKGEPRVSLSVSGGFSDLAVPIHESVTVPEYFELAWESIRNGYLDDNPGATNDDAAQFATNNLLSYLRINPFNVSEPVGTDGKLNPGASLLWNDTWEDALFKSRGRQEYNFSLSGATDNTDYYFSAGYLNDKGALTNSEFERISARLNISSQVKKWFKTGLNTSFSTSYMNIPDQERTIRFVRDISNAYPIYEWDYDENNYKTGPDGELVFDFGLYRPDQAWPNHNPLAEAKYNQRYSDLDNLSARTFADITPFTWLTLRTTFNVDFAVSNGYIFNNGKYGWAASVGGNSTRSRDRHLTYTLNNLLIIDHAIGHHSFNLLAGHEAFHKVSNYLSGSKENFPIEGLTELGAAATLLDASSSEDNISMESWLSRLEYNYMGKYYLSGSFRRDGSSRFHPDSRWGSFWSVGASWRISEEAFMDSFKWLDNFTWKISYGSQGNDNVGSLYAYQGLYNSGWNDLTNPGFLISSLANPVLHWESNYQLNTGIETRILQKLSLSAEYYNRISQDLLFWRPLPPSAGIGSIASNIGAIRNRGVDIHLSNININSASLRWETELTLSHFRNKIVSLPEDEISAGYHRYKEGKSVYDFYLKKWAGVDPDNGMAMWWKNIYETDGEGNPVLDEHGEKIIVGQETTYDYGEADYAYVGSALPDLYGSIINNFYFKGFDLSFMFYFSLGGKIMDTDYSSMMHPGSRIGANFSKDILDRWTPDNRETNVPRLSTSSSAATSIQASTRFLYDASFARLRNVTLGYSIPENIVSQIGVSKARAFVKADNILTIFQRKGLDPDQNIGGTTGNRLTTMKSISFGINVSF